MIQKNEIIFLSFTRKIRIFQNLVFFSFKIENSKTTENRDNEAPQTGVFKNG